MRISDTYTKTKTVCNALCYNDKITKQIEVYKLQEKELKKVKTCFETFRKTFNDQDEGE